MKRLVGFMSALFTCVIFLVTYNLIINNRINSNERYLNFVNTQYRNQNIDLVKKLLNEKTVLLLGSSELSSVNSISYPSYVFNSDKLEEDVFIMGQGHSQSLIHTINAGAFADGISSKKVAMIVSPQWFQNPNETSESFASVFSPKVYQEFIKNKNISDSIKSTVALRVEQLLASDKKQQNNIKIYNDVYIRKQVYKMPYIWANDLFWEVKNDYDYYNKITKNEDIEKISCDKIEFESWDDLKKMSVDEAKKFCNNEFIIDDEYYEIYIKDKLETFEGSMKDLSYCTSEEYKDLQLFLDVCKENNLEVMLISVPVNGRWYDYCKFPRKDREEYYSNIRKIAKENDVNLADFSNHEYDNYFLKDIMHLGWKGWVYVDEAIDKFFKGE